MTANADDLPQGIPAPGDVLSGKYQIERVIGMGGMGVVLAAQHVTLGQRVAVKMLLPHVAKLPEAAKRFLREARASTNLRSEHVARVVDVGTQENGAPYMVMEHLEGKDLHHWPARSPSCLSRRRSTMSCKRPKRSRRRTRWASFTAI